MAFFKIARAGVVASATDPKKWEDSVLARCVTGGSEVFADRKFIAEFDPKKHLLSHCTIVSSVVVEQEKDRNYLVRPEASAYINDNGDCWQNEVLGPPLNAFKTFVGADNFQEHVQIKTSPFLKGQIVDAALRKVPLSSERDSKEDLYVYYTDILVRTDRSHSDLVARIESGEMSTLSMGCNVQSTRCTACGHVAHDDTETCEHVRYQKRNAFHSPDGYKRVIAELCGSPSEEGSVVFIEASWVRTPAFGGAVVRNILNPVDFVKDDAVLAGKFAERMMESQYAGAMAKAASRSYWQMSAPAEVLTSVRAILATADELRRVIAQEPEKKEEAPATEDVPKEEAPAAEGETPAADAPAGEGVTKEFMEGLPEDAKVLTQPGQDVLSPAPAPAPPPSPTGFALVKEELKKTLRDVVKQELLEELAKEKKEEAEAAQPAPVAWDRMNEGLIQSSLNKDSFDEFKKVFAGEGIPDDQLRVIHSGVKVLLRKGWRGLGKKFSSRQILAVARFVDQCLGDLAPHPLSPEGYRAVLAAGGRSGGLSLGGFFRKAERIMGRKIKDTDEAQSLIVKAHLYDLGKQDSTWHGRVRE